MGRDKARIEWHGAPLVEQAARELAAVCDRVLLACGGEPRYAELGHALVLDRAPDLGPLAGLEAGLRAVPEGWVVCLPCDMPHAGRAVLERLAECVERDDLDACLLSGPRGVEPLCAVYHTRLADCARAALDAGERKMTAILEQPLPTGRAPRWAAVDVRELGAEAAIVNVNTPEDLDRARAAAGGREDAA